jgi:hypothetical protein
MFIRGKANTWGKQILSDFIENKVKRRWIVGIDN